MRIHVIRHREPPTERIDCLVCASSAPKSKREPSQQKAFVSCRLVLRNQKPICVTEERWNLFDKSWWRMTCPTLREKKLLFLGLLYEPWGLRWTKGKSLLISMEAKLMIFKISQLLMLSSRAALSNHANGKSYSTINCSDCFIADSGDFGCL